ncbi:hypothetical protein LCGC14_3088040 [marine sediment metagenome]|uniref:Uncharacterized protein n=1 Tax=marine sediment metagenome TaxID=412755 RepID=A0A0F8WB90_9ZZZZ
MDKELIGLLEDAQQSLKTLSGVNLIIFCLILDLKKLKNKRIEELFRKYNIKIEEE